MKTQFKYSLLGASIAAVLATVATPVLAQEEQASQKGKVERIMVTANRVAQDVQEVSSSITALDEKAIERAGIIDITGLENVVPGLRIGKSGGEVRPAMRGARTNEVGVAGTGIAEQVVGIFQDGIYVPTTTAGLGAYVDVERIEVLRGPQGTLYGRNTFAGSINVITNQPEFDDVKGSFKVTHGNYNRAAYEAIVNLPLSDKLATRLVMASNKHDGVIENLFVNGKSDDLREKNNFYVRSVTRYEPSDSFDATLRLDYFKKEGNSEAIWGYQQVAGYAISETAPGSGIFNPNATVEMGHIYQPGDAQRQDLGPYHVYRNAVSFDNQDAFSMTTVFNWSLEDVDVKWTTNYSKLDGEQFYDNDYSDGGIDFVGGFGRQDDHETYSSEVQIVSTTEGPLQWIAGLYWFKQEADWEWLWREDTTGDGVADNINVPGWGNPNHDPHNVDSLAVFGQLRYQLSDDTRLVGGLRFNKDDKSFTGTSIPDWDDSSVLWKAAVEHDMSDDLMVYATASTGMRTGGANDGRVVSRGAQPTYDNEEVISYELGMKSYLLDGAMRLNAAFYMNEYDDVKAQLFAVACSDTTSDLTAAQCAQQGVAQTFEYYQNGGGVDTMGFEADMQYLATDNLTIVGSFAWVDSEFSSDYTVGTELIQPLAGLGNLDGRQDVNNPAAGFSFAGWTPAMNPKATVGLSFIYEKELENGGLVTPYLQLTHVGDYYAFDTNLPETKVSAHTMVNARISWDVNDNLTLEAYVDNLTDRAVMTRAVVHSQIRNGLPINSVQANWNMPRMMGVNAKYTF
ncbi:MAG: TonB-dependent receptor [Glaciecola sp.]